MHAIDSAFQWWDEHVGPDKSVALLWVLAGVAMLLALSATGIGALA